MYFETNNLIPITILKKLKSHNPPPAPSSSPGSSLGCHDFVIGAKGFQLAVAVFRRPGSAEGFFFPTDWTDGTCDSVVSLEMNLWCFCRNVLTFRNFWQALSYIHHSFIRKAALVLQSYLYNLSMILFHGSFRRVSWVHWLARFYAGKIPTAKTHCDESRPFMCVFLRNMCIHKKHAIKCSINISS